MSLKRIKEIGRDEVEDELKKIGEEIRDYMDIIGQRMRVMNIVKEEMIEVREELEKKRRKEIGFGGEEMEEEEMIEREDMVVKVSNEGYIKRVKIKKYSEKRRGGKGS